RALSLIGTGDSVIRDMFYDGHPRAEPGAVICRMAPSFLRFGNFEIFASRGDEATLRQLGEYTSSQLFPELGPPSPGAYVSWFEEICRRTAALVVDWMRVGFVHGVLNTDNMSILGLTIDYGPYGWLEDFDPGWTPNTTDAAGRRYCYGSQPQIAHWNLVRLANALYPLINDKAPLEQGLARFAETYESAAGRMMADKLGLAALDREDDDRLLTDLFALLQQVETDVTLFFRLLATVPVADEGLADGTLVEPLRRAFYAEDAFAPDHVA